MVEVAPLREGFVASGRCYGGNDLKPRLAFGKSVVPSNAGSERESIDGYKMLPRIDISYGELRTIEVNPNLVEEQLVVLVNNIGRREVL
ncbi:MAG: hypothetical protein JNK90_00920 [Planctomycetaceae bacterium]|nr:hypothetical protein [Planctomycetaceae bacterium]